MSPSPPPAAAPAQEPEEQQPEKQEQEQAPVAEEDGEGDVKMDEPTADAEAVAEDEAAPDAEAEESSKPESSKSKPKSAGKSAPRPASKASKAKNISSSKDKDGAFSANDIVLAKLRGYPKWPAKVVAEEDIPQNVMADRGKNGNFCVRFFPVGDYAWLAPRDLSHLKPHEISAFINEPHKKKGDLMEAYKIAADPAEWEEQKNEEQAAAEEAAADEDEGVDELDEADDAETGGKRKRAEPKKDAKKKKAKLEALSKRQKNADKGSEDEAPKKKATKAKPAKNEKKPVSAAEEGNDDSDPLSKDPEAVKVKEWRHKLQRAFLSTKGVPAEADMGTYSQLFTTIEEYGDKMTIPYLQHSKIGKVMKKIALLKDLPNDDEFKITQRASSLMDTWSKILEPGAANGDKPEPESKAADEPATENGDAPAAPEVEAEA